MIEAAVGGLNTHGAKMAIFRVLVWLNGKRAGNKYKKVEAASAKEAAEKSYGGSLYAEGSFGQIRAEVKPMGIGGPTIFYEH